MTCSSLFPQDGKKLIENLKLNSLQEDSEAPEIDEDELAEMYGYGQQYAGSEVNDDLQVHTLDRVIPNNILIKNSKCAYGYIQPVPTQILTVFLDPRNTIPFHIELDSGATVSYVREDIALKYKFPILPNKQISKLGDGFTKLVAAGEINIHLFRKSHCIYFHAIVCKNLTAEAIGGTNFMRQNAIEQDLVHNRIHINNRKITCLPTNETAVMPEVSLFGQRTQVNDNRKQKPQQLLSFKSRVLLPN